MRNQEDSPRYWRHRLQEQEVSQRVERSVSDYYRALRRAQERMWTFAYAGAVAGATLGIIVAASYVGFAIDRRLALPSVGIMALVATLVSSLAWWITYSIMHRAPMRRGYSRLTGVDLPSEQAHAEVILDAVAEALASGQSRPRDEQSEINQLTQVTMIKGLREAPTSEIERQLLERLVGSAFVPIAEGGIFVFKQGPPCARCGSGTRTGPLRILNLPGHWAAENRYPRAAKLPPRGRHLQAVPERTLELAEFLVPAERGSEPSQACGPDTEMFLCDDCAKAALGHGLARQARDQRP